MLFKGYLSTRVLYCIKAIAQRHYLYDMSDTNLEILRMCRLFKKKKKRTFKNYVV